MYAVREGCLLFLLEAVLEGGADERVQFVRRHAADVLGDNFAAGRDEKGEGDGIEVIGLGDGHLIAIVEGNLKIRATPLGEAFRIISRAVDGNGSEIDTVTVFLVHGVDVWHFPDAGRPPRGPKVEEEGLV